MDFYIKLNFKQMTDEYINVEIEPSRPMEIEEVIHYLEFTAETLENPPPQLVRVK